MDRDREQEQLQNAPTLSATTDPGARIDEVLEQRARVGRYVLLERLGAGGMGVVYAAFDPDLDRRIAIKLVRSPDRGDARLVREGMAMARLHHPNVIAIHDVGVHDGQVFLAMDLVDGTTLRAWLAERERTWREVLAVFARAGQGLAAAHRAGIVHRDFKPDNVLVARDGRVVVTDFGLARVDERDDAHGDSGVPLANGSTRLTVSGSLLGTPAFMAPEQHHRAPADARSDQFSFCVALYDALYEEHPFAPPDAEGIAPLVALADAVTAGRLRPEPPGARVPGWLRRAIVRGLAVAPEQRWPTMDALLQALDADPVRRRRRAALGVGVAIVAATGTFAFTRDRATVAPPPCRSFATRLAGVWDAPAREAAHRAVTGSGAPFAARAWDLAAADLDRYAASWVGRARDVCEATVVRHEQSSATHDLRARCLDHRLRALAALASALAHADAAAIERAPAAAAGLPELEVCDAPALLVGFAAPPDTVADPRAIAAVERRLAAARAALDLGHYADGAIVADQAYVAAAPLGDPGLAATAGSLAAVLASAAGRPDATSRLEAAAFAADGAGRDEARFEALAWLIDAYVAERRFDDARRVVRQARAVLDRLGAPRPRDERTLRNSAAQLAVVTDELDEALRLRREELEWAERITPRDDATIGKSRVNLGSTLAQRGDLDGAGREIAAGRELVVRALGPEHPQLGTLMTIEGAIAYLRQDFAAARPLLARAVELQRRALGPEHPSLKAPLYNLTRTDLELGRLDDALAEAQQGLAIARAQPSAGGTAVAQWLSVMAAIHTRAGRPADAIAPAEEALSILRAGPAEPTEIASAAFVAGRALWTADVDRKRARALVDEALRLYGAEHAAFATFVTEIERWKRDAGIP